MDNLNSFSIGNHNAAIVSNVKYYVNKVPLFIPFQVISKKFQSSTVQPVLLLSMDAHQIKYLPERISTKNLGVQRNEPIRNS